MAVVTLLILPVIVGWLATLVMHSDIRKITYLSFGAAVIGAEVAAAVIAPAWGIPMTGEYGLTVSGTFLAWLGAVSVLALVFIVRHCATLIGMRRRRHYLACTRKRLKSARCPDHSLAAESGVHRQIAGL